MNSIRKLAVAASVVAAFAAPSAFAELITNGGFETGDFTGWTVSASFTSVESSGFTSPPVPHSGSFFAALGHVGGLGTLSQTFSDIAGQSLHISMWMASDGETPNEFSVDFNGSNLFDQTDIPATRVWGLLTFNVTATGSDTLTISERNDPGYLGLDDVSVSVAAVPEPVSLALVGLGLAGLGFSRRKKA